MTLSVHEIIEADENLLCEETKKFIEKEFEVCLVTVSLIPPGIMEEPTGYAVISVWLKTEIDKVKFLDSQVKERFERASLNIVVNDLGMKDFSTETVMKFTYDSEENIVQNHNGDFYWDVR